jgi:hypothetical protein
MEAKANTKNKIVSFRLKFDLYNQYLKEAEKENITLTDYIIKKLNDSSIENPLEKRIIKLEKQNKKIISKLIKQITS